MTLTFYNTLSRSLEVFKPIKNGKVSLYTCGPTVYNFAHIGNFRAYVFEDILRRTLTYFGYKVTQVMNLTDVDDKTIRDSRAAGVPLNDFTEQYKKAFFEDLNTLGIEKSEFYPAATNHIPEMITLIKELIEKRYAYIGEDKSVYFSIDKFPSYGKLANVDLTEQRPGARVQSDEYGKESIADFALWKHWNEHDGDVYWESPWGRGRPGWHIECSAMSIHFLGNHFDIHTGGVDNMFPHHEDEIAQCEAATGEKFVNYWLHCEHLMVNGSKMSKSLGNFYTLRDILDKGFSGREIRWLLMSSHYRQQLNFTFEGLTGIRSALRKIDDFILRLKEIADENDGELTIAEELTTSAETAFSKGLQEDLNTPVAFAAFFDFVREGNRAMDNGKIGGVGATKLLKFCRKLDTVLGALDIDSSTTMIPAEIQNKLSERLLARKNRDFAKADSLRDEIIAAGWRIEDTAKGTRLIPIKKINPAI